VLAVDVSLQTARAVVRFDAAQADARRLELAVEEAGYEIRR
jgi:copper chaperone CopZ